MKNLMVFGIACLFVTMPRIGYADDQALFFAEPELLKAQHFVKFRKQYLSDMMVITDEAIEDMENINFSAKATAYTSTGLAAIGLAIPAFLLGGLGALVVTAKIPGVPAASIALGVIIGSVGGVTGVAVETTLLYGGLSSVSNRDVQKLVIISDVLQTEVTIWVPKNIDLVAIAEKTNLPVGKLTTEAIHSFIEEISDKFRNAHNQIEKVGEETLDNLNFDINKWWTLGWYNARYSETLLKVRKTRKLLYENELDFLQRSEVFLSQLSDLMKK